MGRRGTKPKPTARKRAEGNPGKRPLNEDEPQCGVAATCPNWLSTEAKSEWRRLAPMLREWGLLTAAERAIFAILCESYADVQRLTVELREGGLEGLARRHRETARADAMRMVVRISAELGLSPSARTGLKAPKLAEPGSLEEFWASSPVLRLAKGN